MFKKKLKITKKKFLQASLNLEDELTNALRMEADNNRHKNIDKTRGNMIKMLTENITKLESRIQSLENKD